jgi:PKD repeat protein
MLYEWDLNNDGEYEQSSTSAKTTNEFSTKGSYQIWLRVTDDDGLTDTETFIITVEDSKEGIPGFEFILAVLSIIVTIIYSKRKK